MTSANDVVVGVFAEREDADRAIEGLHEAGFDNDHIAILAHDAPGDVRKATTSQGRQGKTAAATSVIGGVVGAAAASLIPGIGIVVGSGILAAAIGAAMGATGGLWVGGLTDIGVPEADAKYYETEFQSGRTLLVVRTDGRPAEAEQVLKQHGAVDTERRGEMPHAA